MGRKFYPAFLCLTYDFDSEWQLAAKHDAEAAHSLPFSSHRVSLLSHAL